MNPLLSILRENPGLIVGLGLCVGIPLVLAILRAAGTPWRPLFFIGSLTLPLATVFLIASLVRAHYPPEPSESFRMPMRDGHFADREKLFGADIPERQILDAKSLFPQCFAAVDRAELGIIATGETALVAQFPTEEQAELAAKYCWQIFQIYNTSGDEESGWRGQRRTQSDYIEMLRTGSHLFYWTGPTPQAAAARRAASPLLSNSPELKPESPTPVFASLQPLGELFAPIGMKIAGVLLMVALYVGCFFMNYSSLRP